MYLQKKGEDWLSEIGEVFSHPSGQKRILSMKLYIEDDHSKDEALAFKERFLAIWNMD